MSIYANLLGRIDHGTEPNPVLLQKLFDWFVSLDLQYETASNIVGGSIVRSSSAIVESIRRDWGAHCIEHAQLFKDLLLEFGFQARLVNASHKDYITRTAAENSMTYTLVDCQGQRFLCDTFYTQELFALPAIGGRLSGAIYTRRIDDEHVSFAVLANGTVIAEDLVNEASDPQQRSATMQARFPDFTPFGVFVPYFQTVRPYRRAIFYAPKFDRFTLQEGDKSHPLPLEQLPQCFWIPAPIRLVIEQALEVSRAQRDKTTAALRFGVANPHYQTLKH